MLRAVKCRDGGALSQVCGCCYRHWRKWENVDLARVACIPGAMSCRQIAELIAEAVREPLWFEWEEHMSQALSGLSCLG